MTERQQLSPAALDHLAVPAFLIRPDAAGNPRYVGANAEFLACTGLCRDELIGKTACEVFEPPAGPATFERHRRAIGTGMRDQAEETLGLGTIRRRFRTSLVPVNDKDSGRYLVGTAIDVTAEHEMRTLQAAEQSRLSQVEQFIALAAHDLRAPMRNIQTLAEMLRETMAPDDAERLILIDLLEDVAIKSGGMISDLLEHTQTVHMTAEVSAFDFGLMCRNLCNVLDPSAAHRVTWPEAMVETDRLVVEVCLRNLIENAIKHGGCAALDVAIAVDPTADGLLRIRVCDNGHGFENPSHAFLASGTVSADGGYGLMGIRRLLTARGGRISLAEPAGGIGSAVEVVLPGRLLNVQIPRRRARTQPPRPESRRDAIGMTDKE